MITTRLRQAEVETCPHCNSLWLDSNELAALVGSWMDLPRPTPPAAPITRKLNCPRCLCHLQTWAYSELRRTYIDHCPDCQGIWLDRGELERILSEVYNF